MKPVYVGVILLTLLTLARVLDAGPLLRGDDADADDDGDDGQVEVKRGGISSRFRGNSFRQSISPLFQQRNVLPSVLHGEDENEATGSDSASRDRTNRFLASVLGIGWKSSDALSSNWDRLYGPPEHEYESRYGTYLDDSYDDWDYSSRHHQYYYDDDDDDYYYYYYDDDDVYEDGEDDEEGSERTTRSKVEPPTRRHLVDRDYLGTVLGMGGGGRAHSFQFDHAKYNEQYYYDDDDDDYYYYDDYYDDYYPDEYNDVKKTVKRTDEGKEDKRNSAVKRRTPTLVGLENQLENLKVHKRKTPTLEDNQFMRAIRRFMRNERYDNDVNRK